MGCGSGVVTVAAVQRGWRVLAVDPDADMTAMTRTAVGDYASSAAIVVRAGLPRTPLGSGAADAVLANFVLNHVADPRRAVREVARILRPGGLAAMTIWPAGGAGWTDLVSGAFDDAGALAHAAGRLPPHLDFERSVSGLAGLAGEAGLHVTRQHPVMWTWQVRPADLWAGVEGGLAGAGARYRAQSAKVRRAVRTAFDARADDAAREGLLQFGCRAAFVLARAPS